MKIPTANQEAQQLAVLGGTPAFEGRDLYVNKPTQPSRTQLFSFIQSALDANQYSNQGPMAQELEEKIACYLGVKHCVLVSSGTMGLQVLCEALGLTGEVILPSFTFIATAHAISWLGLKPVFCDVDPQTHNICLKHCQELITTKTTAILAVHLWGSLCDVAGLEAIAKRNNLALIFDSAHAFSCGNERGLAGGFGEAEAFSFHATKSFHTGEGGAVTTNSDVLAQKLRQVRNFGFVDFNETACMGINGKMSEFHAALGLANFDLIGPNKAKCKEVYDLYCERINEIAGLKIQQFKERHNFHYIVIEVLDNYGLSRDTLMKTLIKEGVHARRHFYPGCHNMIPYKKTSDQPCLPFTDSLSKTCLVLPGGANISRDEVIGVCEILVVAKKNAPEIKGLAWT